MIDETGRTAVIDLSKALADDTRLRILAILLESEGRPLTVTDLAEQLGLAQPRISTHLAILLEADLVDMRASGRARLYRIRAERARPALDGLLNATDQAPLAPISPLAARALRNNTPYRNARTCYDHLAGRAAVDLLDGMVFDRWLVRAGGPDERPRFDLTESGIAALNKLGIGTDVLAENRRIVACGCLDWTERKPHLAGSLGAAVLNALIADGYVRRDPTPRHLTVLRDLDEWSTGRHLAH
ncbi:MAG TPA: metalloregulator ArsR/SmtB family transcription factor [Thermomicrobiales bacterium]|nr:metalloregulator ArsR/SmtB family transcription factor [Thermomicrobiales bacterium]HRA48052.1 metalloregulator ArsR/SmtB family transcription factor [Thermomicrobiales bacterium]